MNPALRRRRRCFHEEVLCSGSGLVFPHVRRWVPVDRTAEEGYPEGEAGSRGNEDKKDIRSACFCFHEFELVLVYLGKFLHDLISLGYWS